jgi:signal transduction histidine kinase
MKENKFEKLVEKLNSLDTRELHMLIRRLYSEQKACYKVFNLVSDGVLILSNRWAIEYGNCAANEIFELPNWQQPLDQCVPELSFLKQSMQAHKESIPFTIKELEIKYPSKKILNISGMHLSEHKNDLLILVIHDATAAKNLIDQRVESERFSTINLLASGVAHELGNPLNAIGLRLQLMQKQVTHVTADGGEQLQKSISVCREEIDRLDGVIENFLQAIRPQKLVLRPTNVEAVIDRVVNTLAPELLNRSISVIKNFSATPLILADEKQLEQAFFNIIKNAMEASPNCSNILVRNELNATQLIVEFVDSGSGIEEEDMPKIAKPYFSTKKSGNGLGLMVVERILREHGAILTIESRPGLGTKIMIIFPVKDPSLPLLPTNWQNKAGKKH